METTTHYYYEKTLDHKPPSQLWEMMTVRPWHTLVTTSIWHSPEANIVSPAQMTTLQPTRGIWPWGCHLAGRCGRRHWIACVSASDHCCLWHGWKCKLSSAVQQPDVCVQSPDGARTLILPGKPGLGACKWIPQAKQFLIKNKLSGSI